MHENTWRRVAFLVNLMFRRLDKFDGLIFEGCVHTEGRIYSGCSLGHIAWGSIFEGGLGEEGGYIRGAYQRNFMVFSYILNQSYFFLKTAQSK